MASFNCSGPAEVTGAAYSQIFADDCYWRQADMLDDCTRGCLGEAIAKITAQSERTLLAQKRILLGR